MPLSSQKCTFLSDDIFFPYSIPFGFSNIHHKVPFTYPLLPVLWQYNYWRFYSVYNFFSFLQLYQFLWFPKIFRNVCCLQFCIDDLLAIWLLKILLYISFFLLPTSVSIPMIPWDIHWSMFSIILHHSSCICTNSYEPLWCSLKYIVYNFVFMILWQYDYWKFHSAYHSFAFLLRDSSLVILHPRFNYYYLIYTYPLQSYSIFYIFMRLSLIRAISSEIKYVVVYVNTTTKTSHIPWHRF